MSQSSPGPDGCQDLGALGRAGSECRSERPLAPPRWTNPFDRTGCSRYQHRFHILFGGIGLSSGLRMIPARVRTRIRIRSPLSWRKKRLSHPWTEGAAVLSRIVVGVDGSPASIRALKWALDQAALTGAAVEAINAWQYPQVLGSQAPAIGFNFSANAKQILQNAVESVGASIESVTTRTVLGHPVQVLVDASEGADLLVVGSRGHGGFVGMLLGSVSGQVSTYAQCPTVIVPA